MIAELAISACLVLGGFFALAGSIGLARLPDFYSRLHGPTKATTLGVGGLLVASMLYFSLLEEGVIVHELLIAMFLFMTAPVSAHLLAKAAIRLRLPTVTATTPEARVRFDVTAAEDGHGGSPSG
jgi:multicomponent K+:H+ antiporter subunit G